MRIAHYICETDNVEHFPKGVICVSVTSGNINILPGMVLQDHEWIKVLPYRADDSKPR